jgi:hypothetical protein
VVRPYFFREHCCSVGGGLIAASGAAVGRLPSSWFLALADGWLGSCNGLPVIGRALAKLRQIFGSLLIPCHAACLEVVGKGSIRLGSDDETGWRRSVRSSISFDRSGLGRARSVPTKGRQADGISYGSRGRLVLALLGACVVGGVAALILDLNDGAILFGK